MFTADHSIIWKTFYAALTHGEDEGLKSLLCHTCCRVSWYTSTGVGQLNYLLSKNGQESNLGSGWQEICDDLSSVRSGTGVLQSVAPGAMACTARWMRGHTILSLQRKSVREPWMTLSCILPQSWIHADPHHYWSSSIVMDLPNSASNEAFSEPKTDASPAIVESNSEAGESSVKEIMDHCCLVQGPWHGCSSQLESWEFWLHAAFFGPNEIHAT